MSKLVKGSTALAALALAITPALSRSKPVDAAFSRFSDHALTQFMRNDPSHATQQGDHHYDALITDFSRRAVAQQVAADRALLKMLAGFKRAQLSRDNQIDASLLQNQLEHDIWAATTLKDWIWDPQVYNDAAGASLYGLAARDFAPWPQRLHNATVRMEKLPALLAQARANLVPAKVPPIFATTVAKQNSGIVEIAETMLAPHADTLSPAERARFNAALAKLKVAVAEHQTWLDKTLLPNARGDFRLGARLYDAKLRFALDSPLDRATIKARATQSLADTRAQMYAIARSILNGKTTLALPDQPSATEQQAAISAALDLTYAQRPKRTELEADARGALAKATEFVRAHDLLSLPTAPINVIQMPKFQQGANVAYCDPPGPLESSLPTFYAVSPIPAEWSDAQAESFLREYNEYMVHDLSIHEAMPGHYVQLAHANAAPSKLRAVLYSSPFVEGWAVYAEGMMADQGYLDNDPLFKLTVLKMRLRSITNALLDIGIQTENLSEAEAMRMMTQGAFQQEREASGKWTRARLTSAQLPSYFVGYSEHMALREDVKAKWGAGYGLKKYNEAVLAHGSPAVHYVRALLLDKPIN